MGPEAFLEPLDACGLWSCARTHLKRPCAAVVRLVGRMTNTKYQFSQPLFRAEAVQQTVWHLCRTVNLEAQGAVPPGFNSLWRG